MAAPKTFKQRNAWLIKGYVLLNIVVFFAVNNILPDLQSGVTVADGIKIGKVGVASVALNVLALLLANVLPTGFKEFLVYWRVKNRLPGCRAFTKLAVGDPRINLKAVKAKVGCNLPKDPQKQGEVWYKLLKEYEVKVHAIGEDHRMTLLFRDLTAVSFLVVPLLGIPSFWFVTESVPWLYLAGLAVVCLLMSLAGRSVGNRLVRNVLAQASLD